MNFIYILNNQIVLELIVLCCATTQSQQLIFIIHYLKHGDGLHFSPMGFSQIFLMHISDNIMFNVNNGHGLNKQAERKDL